MPRVNAKRQIALPIAQCREVGIGPGDEYRGYVADGRIAIVRKTAGAARGDPPPRGRRPCRQRGGLAASPAGRVDALIAVDTGVLLRHLPHDGEAQVARAGAGAGAGADTGVLEKVDPVGR